MGTWPELPALVAGALAVSGVVQGAAGWIAARRFLAGAPRSGVRPPISVLKPLHGSEALLEAALASFCAQDYPEFQLVCGVAGADDPAIAVVERVRRRFPAADVTLVVNPMWHGPNRKIGNLVNMSCAAKHDTLVVSDSDMHVSPDYLARVADALAAPGVGLVTSLYVGLPARRSIANLLEAAHINQNFASGALVGRALGRQDCLGATMALTRDTLRAVGGFKPLAAYVADDAVLGQAVRGLGLGIAMVPNVPATTVDEAGLVGLVRHELRWARTIRAVEPVLFSLTLIQYPAFWALVAVALGGATPAWIGFAAAVVALRAGAGRLMERALGAARTPLWLAPVRDVLSVLIACAAYTGNRVSWQGETLSMQADVERRHAVAASAAPPQLAAEGSVP